MLAAPDEFVAKCGRSGGGSIKRRRDAPISWRSSSLSLLASRQKMPRQQQQRTRIKNAVERELLSPLKQKQQQGKTNKRRGAKNTGRVGEGDHRMMLRPRAGSSQQQQQQQHPMWSTSGGHHPDYASAPASSSSSSSSSRRHNHNHGISLLQQSSLQPPAPGKRRTSLNDSNDQDDDRALDEMVLIKEASRACNSWHWSEVDKSNECILSDDKLTVTIHPNCSESAAACLGSKPFKRDGNYYYWELLVLDKTYGTSVMFGLCTSRQRLHLFDYCNLIGLDEQGWSLSHKGLIWHDGNHRQYTQMFPTNQPIKLGLLLNTMRGELSYYMNGRNLGVAFCGLNDIDEPLYPVVGSTAKCTRIRLLGSYCGYVSLLERSCFTVLKNSPNPGKLLEYLNRQYQLPNSLINYLAQAAQQCGSDTAIKTSAANNGDKFTAAQDMDDEMMIRNQ